MGFGELRPIRRVLQILTGDDRLVRHRQVEVRDRAANRLGVVAGDHLEGDALGRERLEDSRGVRAQFVGQCDQRHTAERTREACWVGRRHGDLLRRHLGEHEHAQPRNSGGYAVRRAKVPGLGAMVSGAPSTRTRSTPPSRRRTALKRFCALNGIWSITSEAASPRAVRNAWMFLFCESIDAVREQGQTAAGLGLGQIVGQHAKPIEPEPVGGQRAGLVGADDVDGGHRLDGVEPLDECAASADDDRADGERDRRGQDQSLRNHRRDRGRDHQHEPIRADELEVVEREVQAAEDECRRR